jgi:CRP-like cAMP-binding protein
MVSTHPPSVRELPHYQQALFQPADLKGLGSLAVIARCHRGQEICSQGRPAEAWYCVVLGIAKRYVVRADGRRQILELLLPGDYFGFTTGEEYDSTVEAAAADTIIARYRRRRVEMLVDTDQELAREVRQITFAALSRLQAQLLILGRITAVEKVGCFLLEMAARLPEEPSNYIKLPISRYDIADCLALSVETVSRSLTSLKRRGIINLDGARSIAILDRSALADGHNRGNGKTNPL